MMTSIKIVSNPYTRDNRFFSFKEQTQEWEDIKYGNANSKLAILLVIFKANLLIKLKFVARRLFSSYFCSSFKGCSVN